MAVKKVTKKAAKIVKKAGKKKRAAKSKVMAPQDLRTLIYLWLYATVSDFDFMTSVGDTSTANVAINAKRVTDKLTALGGEVNVNPTCLNSIIQAVLDAGNNPQFAIARGFLINASSTMKGGWSGTEGHPTPPELNSVFIPLSAQGPRGKK